MPTPPFTPDDLAGVLLNRTACAVRRVTEEALAPLGISSRHFGILATLSCHGPLTQQAIGETLRIDRTTVVHLVDELEALTAVLRRVHPSDRRAHALELTAAGRALLAKAGRRVRKAEAQFLSPLGARERSVLQRLLSRLLESPPAAAHNP